MRIKLLKALAVIVSMCISHMIFSSKILHGDILYDFQMGCPALS
jgi:hypothetical protein